jgi:hypothetical protein
LNRAEEAAAFYQQAANKYLELGDERSEGFARSNLGATLRKLHRLDEARQEILRAIACGQQFGHASEPWMTWANLAAIETDAGVPTLAAETRQKAIAAYLAYRRDGGENYFADGRISLAVTDALFAGDPGTAASLLDEIAAEPNASGLLPFVNTLQTIVGGSRDRALASTEGLDYTMAAEILLLIEKLEAAAQQRLEG